MTVFSLIALMAAVLVVFRATLLLIYAELGRKQDLIKHIYKSGNDFNLAVVIPFLSPSQAKGLNDLIGALAGQDYPSERVGIFIGTTVETQPLIAQSANLPANVSLLPYPKTGPTKGKVTAWVIDRLLASGGDTRLFVFLDATDIVRPDFFKNITSRAFDSFVMQGYLALKRPPTGLFATVVATAQRLINRIENAGRYHLGLSSTLMSSGWVIRQELLEMLPFRLGEDWDNTEYTTRLNLAGYHVSWAPNVVTYKDDQFALWDFLQLSTKTILNRLRLGVEYLPATLFQAMKRTDITLVEAAWRLIKPPHFVLGALMVGATVLSASPQSEGWVFSVWSVITVVFLTTQLLSLAVARLPLKETLWVMTITPAVFTVGILSLPITLSLLACDAIKMLFIPKDRVRMGRRFDESRSPRESAINRAPSEPTIEENVLFSTSTENTYGSPYDVEDGLKRYATRKAYEMHSESMLSASPVELPQFSATTNALGSPQLTVPKVSQLPITNGEHTVMCEIQTLTETDSDGTTTYALNFEYKQLTYQTPFYKILDQAFYELETKLQSRGFSIMACGSCAYFYRPTASSEGLAKHVGFCIQNRLGQDVNVLDDGVTALSSACGQYTDMVQRPSKVRAWQESLNPAETLV